MQDISRDLYNLNEWALFRLFRVVTGLKLAYNPDLKKIHLAALNHVENSVIDIITEIVTEEFGIQIEPFNEKINYQNAVRRRFLNTTRMTSKLKKIISPNKTTAVMVVSNYWLAPTNLLISQIVHTFLPILGITYLVDGICYVTTLEGRLTKELIQFGAIHEVGHLLGLHGYPLEWLRRKKKSS